MAKDTHSFSDMGLFVPQGPRSEVIDREIETYTNNQEPLFFNIVFLQGDSWNTKRKVVD